MTDSYNFEDEEFNFEREDLFYPKLTGEMSEGEKLKRFQQLFDGCSRALLQECLFRILYQTDGTGTLEILCPNQVAVESLTAKKRKIVNNINTCWENIKFFSLCIRENGKLVCETFSHSGHQIMP